jgi:CBS domain-containing protein
MGIEELMNRFPATCGPDETLSEAAQKMQDSNCAFLPVTAGAGFQCLVGMITDGDICMAAQLRGRCLEELRARDAMARELRFCNPGDSLVKAEAIMQEARIRRLPVVDESGRLLGVLSLEDVAYAAEREALSARITAAQFGLAVSGMRQPQRVGKRMQVAGPAHLPASDHADPGGPGAGLGGW